MAFAALKKLSNYIVPLGTDAATAGLLQANGSVPLTANWNAGNFTITSGNSVDWINVAQAATGGIGTSGSPWTGWETAITWTSGKTYYFQGGTFAMASDPAWANLSNIRLVGDHDSQTIIQITKGAGLGMQITNATYLTTTNWIVENFQVIGNVAGTTTDCFTITNIARSTFRNIRVMNCTGAGFNITGNVLCDFQHLACSNSYSPAFTTIPVNGFILGTSGGNQTVNGCTFDECMAEGVSGSGFKLTGAGFNVFNGGTSENNNRGYELTNATALGNVFNAVDCEGTNGTTDDFLFSAAVNNVIVGGQNTHTIHFAANSVGNVVIAGQRDAILFDLNAFNNQVIGGGINSSNTGSTITDNDGRNHWQSVHDLGHAVALLDTYRDANFKTIENALGGALAITTNVIAPTRNYHTVGAGLIKTITPPVITSTNATVTSGFSLRILPTAAYTYDNTGNINVPAGGGTAVTNRIMDFQWDGTHWSPSY